MQREDIDRDFSNHTQRPAWDVSGSSAGLGQAMHVNSWTPFGLQNDTRLGKTQSTCSITAAGSEESPHAAVGLCQPSTATAAAAAVMCQSSTAAELGEYALLLLQDDGRLQRQQLSSSGKKRSWGELAAVVVPDLARTPSAVGGWNLCFDQTHTAAAAVVSGAVVDASISFAAQEREPLAAAAAASSFQAASLLPEAGPLTASGSSSR